MPFTHYGTLVPRISDEPVVASAWERFLRDHPHHPHEGDGVRRVVLASWQRCRSEAVDPTLHSAPGAADATGKGDVTGAPWLRGRASRLVTGNLLVTVNSAHLPSSRKIAALYDPGKGRGGRPPRRTGPSGDASPGGVPCSHHGRCECCYRRGAG